MKNWLNQDIVVGSVVYRGAREGNSSSFKVGRVIKVNEAKKTVQVQWHGDSKGTPGIDTVVLIDPGVLDWLEEKERISAPFAQERKDAYEHYRKNPGGWDSPEAKAYHREIDRINERQTAALEAAGYAR